MDKQMYKQHMQRALDLAARGWGRTSPNPMVGAVLVKNGKIVGEGYHKGPGLPHAEIAAIKAAGGKVKGAELTVNLEPCNYHGRTPPCTDAIIKSGIKKVIYGMKDPNPRVNGKGLARLRKAGIEIDGPVLEAGCRSFNRIYIHWMKTGRPYVISKIAMSLDGKIATKSGGSKWITGKKCRARMHYWRSGVDAVLVGASTLRTDDPLLNARGMGRVKQPRPIIVTASSNLDIKRRIWDRRPRPIVVCKDGASCSDLEKRGVDIMPIKGRSSRLDWQSILGALGRKGITSVLVEGGGNVHVQLIEKRLAQYMVASMSTKLIGGGGKDWLPGWGVDSVDESPRIKPDQVLVVDDNVIIEGEVVYYKWR